ncbi:21705_t:CDS:2 [Gigaspora rosea]|nr:21705_t:CDS:2 [Gigaspora rosea]
MDFHSCEECGQKSSYELRKQFEELLELNISETMANNFQVTESSEDFTESTLIALQIPDT